MKTKVLIFDMDGNVLDNYNLKSNIAGLAMSENNKKYFLIEKHRIFCESVYSNKWNESSRTI